MGAWVSFLQETGWKGFPTHGLHRALVSVMCASGFYWVPGMCEALNGHQGHKLFYWKSERLKHETGRGNAKDDPNMWAHCLLWVGHWDHISCHIESSGWIQCDSQKQYRCLGVFHLEHPLKKNEVGCYVFTEIHEHTRPSRAILPTHLLRCGREVLDTGRRPAASLATFLQIILMLGTAGNQKYWNHSICP